MHEIQNLHLNGGEKFASFTNGILNGDTKSHTYDYVKKLEANVSLPIKSPHLPPFSKSINEEPIIKEKKLLYSTKIEELLQKYQLQGVNGYDNNQIKERNEEEERKQSCEHEFELLDIYDTESKNESDKEEEEQEQQTKQPTEIKYVICQKSEPVDNNQDLQIVLKNSNIFKEETVEYELQLVSKANITNNSNYLNNFQINKRPSKQRRLLNKNYNKLEKSPRKRFTVKNSSIYKNQARYAILECDTDNSDIDSNSEAEPVFEDLCRSAFDILETASERKFRKRKEYQMGINFISKLREFFNFSKRNTEQEFKRKRRFEEQKEEILPQIKYRRVENNFPKYIESTVDDGN